MEIDYSLLRRAVMIFKRLALFDTGADVTYICAELLGVELEETERYGSFFNFRYLSPFSLIF
jgi:hypothetical protein